MDISAHQRTQQNLFRTILDHGPLTLYSANAKTSSPIGTIHRHFRSMMNAKKIKVYENLDDKRGKIHYGPTLLGIIYFYRFDKTVQSKIEHYIQKWCDYADFVSELKEEGFDTNAKSMRESRSLVRKYVHYFAGVEDQIDLLKDPDALPREALLYIGEFLLVRKPEYMRIWEDLYGKMPTVRKNVDEYMQSSMESYKRLRKKTRKDSQNT